jgi:hypothetical protein
MWRWAAGLLAVLIITLGVAFAKSTSELAAEHSSRISKMEGQTDGWEKRLDRIENKVDLVLQRIP